MSSENSQRLKRQLDDYCAAADTFDQYVHGLLVGCGPSLTEMHLLTEQIHNPNTLIGKRARQVHLLLGMILNAAPRPEYEI
jgi:hypothetical protein